MFGPNKIVSKTFFCLTCKTGPYSEENIRGHGCPLPFEVMENTITCTKKWWARFIDWFLSKDISLVLAIFGVLGMNIILIHHLHMGSLEAAFEGLCFGFVATHILLRI